MNIIIVTSLYVTSFKNSKEEIAARGYPEDFVIQQSEFPLNGYFPPYVCEELDNLVIRKGGQVRENMRLEKLFVSPSSQDCDDVRVVKAQFKNVENNQTEIVPVNTIYMSLGPSMREMNVNGKNILTHTMHSGLNCWSTILLRYSLLGGRPPFWTKMVVEIQYI